MAVTLIRHSGSDRSCDTYVYPSPIPIQSVITTDGTVHKISTETDLEVIVSTATVKKGSFEVNPVSPIIDEHGIEVVLRRRQLVPSTMTSIPRLGTSATESSWPNVRWDHSADIEARPLRISNEIHGDGPDAEYIRSLITNGDLVWTSEVRCPSTAFSHTSWTCNSEMTVDLVALSDSVLNRDRFLVCGLAAAKSFRMNTKGTLPIYDPIVEVAVGSWLCSQSLVYEIGSPIHSLLVWKVNNDLEEGRLSVRSVGPLRYEALARRDLFE